MIAMKLWPAILLVFTLLPACQNAQSTDKTKLVGSTVTSSSGTPQHNGTTFLLGEPAQEEGVLFAFSGYFVNLKRACFQIWRPVQGSTDKFVLRKQWIVEPTVEDSREDIYLYQDGSCLVLQPGDYLGLCLVEAGGPIGYNFNPSQGTTFQYSGKTTEGEETTFDTLPYPYKFSAAAFIYTDSSAVSSGDCPSNVRVPANLEPTLAPITPKPGAPGPKGDSGPIGATGPQGATGPRGAVGAQGIKGEFGSTGPTGPGGLKGSDGGQGDTGARGPAGFDGFRGHVGATGAQGEQGPPGPAGESVGAVSDDDEDCSWCDSLGSPMVVLGLLIWLAVVSVVLIITIALVAYRKHNAADKLRKSQNYKTSQSDLWKKYDAAGYDNEGYETPKMNGDPDPTYSTVEEGRTVF